jgi:L-ascorbate metabolism protein UlaG (beta-lactamase superfamily)
MDITYLGHASFKIRGRKASVVTDPYNSSVGFSYPRVSADVVTVSHNHPDHNDYKSVSGTSRRDKPFIIQYPGEYEVSGISVFGIPSFHDANTGQDRGRNTMYLIQIDDVAVVHLGDLGHILTDKQVEAVGDVDVLLLPVGGIYTIGAKEAVEIVNQLQPAYVIPMHFRTKRHSKKTFGELSTVDDFINEAGYDQVEFTKKLSISKTQLPGEMEVIVLKT